MSAQLRRIWRLLRTLSGDDAYDRYRRHHAQDHSDQPLLDRRAFYLLQQQRKWSGVQRCC
jgi:uncharacterized short protein YbdD (DUF466 family)